MNNAEQKRVFRVNFEEHSTMTGYLDVLAHDVAMARMMADDLAAAGQVLWLHPPSEPVATSVEELFVYTARKRV